MRKALSDWLASDPNRIDPSLHDFVGVPHHVGPACTVEELRADVDRFARTLLGYDWTNRRRASTTSRCQPE
jgi:hypothetical protein